MESDPFYRQLVKVMQESGREGMCFLMTDIYSHSDLDETICSV